MILIKIGIYTDAHFSKSSSILVGSHGNKYSMRLDMLIKSFDWMYQKFDDEKVSLIFNLGDLLSSDNIDPETNSALHEALEKSHGVNELWLIGNHEMKSHDSKLNSLSLLKSYSWIEVVDDFKRFLIDNNSIEVLALSFTNDKDILDNFQAKCKMCENRSIILTHQIYKGMIPGVDLPGLDVDDISNSNTVGVFNGHIHNGKDIGIYHQVGSLSGMSFGDKYDCLPGIIIFDTESLEVKRIPNPFAILFYTVDCDGSIEGLSHSLSLLPSGYSKLLRIKVPLESKENFSKSLNDSTIFEDNNVITYRLKSYGDIEISQVDDLKRNFRNCSIIDSLKTFTRNESTPYSEKEMIEFIDKYLI